MAVTELFREQARAWRQRSFERNLLVLTGVAFLLRLLWALLVPTAPVSDSMLYWGTSQNLADIGSYVVEPGVPFAYWPPGTSLLYAIGIKLFGANFAAIKALNLVSGALLVPAYGLLARRWFDTRAGLLTAAILTFWPSLIIASSVLMSEGHYLTALGWSLVAWKPRAPRFWLNAAVAGLLFGLACLIRPTALLVPFVLLGCSVIRTPAGWLRPLGFAAITAAVMVAAVLPYSLRNQEMFGEFVLISTNAGPNLWMGNNPLSNGGYMPLPDEVSGMSETERAAYLKDEALAFIAAEPAKAGELLVRRVVMTHDRETAAVVWAEKGFASRYGGALIPVLKGLASLYWLVALVLALAAAFVILRQSFAQSSVLAGLGHLANPPLVLWAYHFAVHAVIVGGDRYHLPTIPFVAVFTAMGLMMAHARFTQERKVQPS